MTNEPDNAPRRKLSISVPELPWERKGQRPEAELRAWDEARKAAMARSLEQAEQR